jgi:hypothetical protein
MIQKGRNRNGQNVTILADVIIVPCWMKDEPVCLFIDSLDKTYWLSSDLSPGELHRALEDSTLFRLTDHPQTPSFVGRTRSFDIANRPSRSSS